MFWASRFGDLAAATFDRVTPGWRMDPRRFRRRRLVGFVHHLAAVRGSEIFGYSHMMAVDPAYQNRGVGAQLKWSQRARVLEEGRSFIKWTGIRCRLVMPIST